MTIIFTVCWSLTFSQLIPNGDFENGSINDDFDSGLIPNWLGSHGEPGLASINPGTQYPGSHGNQHVPLSTGGIFTPYNFQAGHNYQVSFWYLTPYSTSIIIKAANGLVNAGDNTGDNLPSVPNEMMYQNNNLYVLTSDYYWTKVTFTYKPSSNYSQLWLYGGPYQPGVGISNGASIDYIEITELCLNLIPPNPPSSFFIAPQATQGIGPVLSNDIDAQNYGGTVTLSGTYKITNSITLRNGLFNILPGTQIFIYGDQNTKINIYGNTNFSSKLKMDNVIFTSGNANMWWGIYIDLYSSVDIKGTNCYSQISHSVNGLHFYDEPINKDFKIDKCSFVHNGQTSIALFGKSLSTSYITNCYFYSSLGSLKNSGVSNATNFSQSFISLMKGSGTYTISGTGPTLISNCTFENALYGIISDNNTHKIQNNTFKNIFQIAYLNYSSSNAAPYDPMDYYAGENTITANYVFNQNTITLPDVWPGTPQLPSINKTTYGIFATMKAKSSNNIIIGAYTSDKTVFNSFSRIGVYNASPFYTIYDNNQFLRLHQALRLKTFNNGNVNVQDNEFVNNVDAIRIPSASNYTSSLVNVSCNSFLNTAAVANTAAIRVEAGAYLNSLYISGGSYTFPNENAFSNMARPIDIADPNLYNGFSYSRTNKNMENPSGPQIYNGVNPNNKFFTMSSATVPQCSSTNGAKYRMGVIEEDISESQTKEMLNQIRFRYCSAEDQARYIRKLVVYYGKKKKMDDLHTWQKPMDRFNKKAFNTLGLFLMDYFRADGKEEEAMEAAEALLTANPNGKEIAARVKYFKLQLTLSNTMNIKNEKTAINDKEQAALKELAYSETSVADIACMLLRLRISNASCPETDTTANIARRAIEEEKYDEAGKISYLGECLPNPVNSDAVIYFNVPEESGMGTLRISNTATGVVSKNLFVKGKDYVNISAADFAPGVYTYTLFISNIPVQTKKLIIVK